MKLRIGQLRSQIVGVDSTFETPFGARLLVYCDYTASGRCLAFVESYLQRLQCMYANPHTEDDVTGRSTTVLLRQAEDSIKRSVNAGPRGRIVACGTGATGAINRLQQIVGVALAPATRENLFDILDGTLAFSGRKSLQDHIEATQPVVFVGPYEHHSNEISWRNSLATTLEVRLNSDGDIDLDHLEDLLIDSRYTNRLRIGSFSAASNVTGLLTNVRRIAELLHKHNAIACFDYAACAPYVEIDMNPAPSRDGEDASIDAIFISPHKFLGGPGSSGILIFNEGIYRRELPPTISAGGTVDYVGLREEDYMKRIEDREKAGTPGVLQTLKAALAFQIKDRIGVESIRDRECELTRRAILSWSENENIEILGNAEPTRRVSIISFNVRSGSEKYLHHRFVTVLLNDLFGIQSRAGCSCAGPYGHRLLNINEELSERYRRAVQNGHLGIKPGWCRVGFHWVMDDIECDYVIEAVHFVARYGHRFLALYQFDIQSGTWTHRLPAPGVPQMSLDSALLGDLDLPMALPPSIRKQLYRQYLSDAKSWLAKLHGTEFKSKSEICEELEALRFFSMTDRE